MPRGTPGVSVRKVPYKYVPRTGQPDDSQLPYRIMDQVVVDCHPMLVGMNIAISWHYGLKPGPDGKVKLGDFVLAHDIVRQKTGHDGDLILNYDWWHNPQVNDDQRAALVDHYLCMPRPFLDNNGDPKVDDLGNIRYFKRAYDVTDYEEVIRRRGIWKHDLQAMAQAMAQAAGYISATQGTVEITPEPENEEDQIDDLPV